jgi:hypothetical protein
VFASRDAQPARAADLTGTPISRGIPVHHRGAALSVDKLVQDAELATIRRRRRRHALPVAAQVSNVLSAHHRIPVRDQPNQVIRFTGRPCVTQSTQVRLSRWTQADSTCRLERGSRGKNVSQIIVMLRRNTSDVLQLHVGFHVSGNSAGTSLPPPAQRSVVRHDSPGSGNLE